MLAATVLFSACSSNGDDSGDGGDGPAAPSAGCAAESTSGAPDVSLLPVPPAAVTVTDAGAEPRRLAAGSPDRSSAQRATLTTTSSVASVTENTQQTVTTPLTARFGCTDATNLEFETGTPTSPDPLLTESLRASDGTRGGLGIAPGLVPISLRLLPTEESGSEARSALEQSLVQAFRGAVALPVEPVGVGATWRTERTISSSATLVQTITARLARWEGNRVTITFTVDESPVDSVFRIPGGDSTLTIARYSFGGSGEVTLDLTRGLPVAGSAELSGARELVGADPSQPLLQQLGFDFSWR